MTWQNEQQKADVAALFAGLVRGYKELDYVACWFLKAAEYVADTRAQSALVATNSICQGELVALLWPLLFSRGVEIGFAHQSFKWKNSAAKNAGVTCVVIGLRKPSTDQKLLFSGEHVKIVKNISPYLIEGDNTIVAKRRTPLGPLPLMIYGNKPSDGGHLILSANEASALLTQHPEAKRFLRRYWGSQEFIKGIERWCLWIPDSSLSSAVNIPEIKNRIEAVRDSRLASDAASTREKADQGHRFIQIQDADREAILIPAVSSEDRPYLQVGLVDAHAIINNRAFAIYDPEMYLVSILSSRLHCVWTHAVAGRLESRINYGNTTVWNTFPMPEISEEQKDILEQKAWDIIAERERHPNMTISEMYAPETMPEGLLHAHKAADEVIELIFIGRSFSSDTERLEHLFKRYKLMTEKQQTPLMAKRAKSRRRPAHA